MDYLTWLTLLQDLEGGETLPELSGRIASFAVAEQEAAEALSALEAAWEASLPGEEISRQVAEEAVIPSKTGGRAEKVRTVGDWATGPGFEEALPYGPATDMEAISRFFERDARRF